MPSRRLSSPSPPTIAGASAAHRHRALLIAVAVSASSLFLLVLLFLVYIYLSLRRSPTLPFPSSSSAAAAACPLRFRRFSYRALRSATASFDTSRSLGRGASAAVFRGLLPDGKSVAVKRLLSSPSSPTRAASSDQEFQNELHVLAALRPSPFVVSLLGYCLEGRRRRLLVYEYMPNGSLQEALFGSSSPVNWDRRFSIILDVAQALAFLHLECDPPVVHGDIKPSNVLLGFDFQAKLSDFGLSRMKAEADLGPEFFSQDLGPSQELFKSQDLVPQSPEVDLALALHASSSISCKNYDTRPDPNSSPRGKEEAAITSPVQDEIFSFEHSKELGATLPLDDGRMESNGQWGKHWWWKQDESEELSNKDYVRDWIGSQICPSGSADWDDGRRISPEKCFEFRNSSRVENLDVGDDILFANAHEKNPEKKQARKKGILACDKKDRKMREWWKEEYFAEISKKGHSKKERKWFPTISSHGKECTSNAVEEDARRGRELNVDISFRKGWKKKRSRSAGSDMFSGDLFSRELSSTTSLRGTVCYVAPECHGCDQFMEKADIYSFGVLILVIVSGRRPLHVLSSPVKLEKANLVSWCRQLAQTGNLLELVDERLKGSYNKDQARLCINLALLFLQRIPELRPDSGDIVKILKGEMELPAVPYEFSPSPPARHFSRSRRKASMDAE